ncbi:MAG: sulfatase-like hydrolase/transferase, partial [Candidatus Aminicenantes bacterium]|nr:sulfatase-like hydrolase/transferase [Candidatus Aminicenantes bacterium]
EHIDDAKIEGSEVPEDVLTPVEWSFDAPKTDWKPVKLVESRIEAVKPIQVDDALRLPLNARNRIPSNQRLFGVIYVELPDWNLEEWAYVEIRARAQDQIQAVGLVFNHTEDNPRRFREGAVVPFYGAGIVVPFYYAGDRAFLMTDGTVQTYRLPLQRTWPRWQGPWTDLGIWFRSRRNAEAATFDILSVRMIPWDAEFATGRSGVQIVKRGTLNDSPKDAPYHRSLYMRTSGRIAYRVRVPKRGRLDVGLGVLNKDTPVMFTISAARQDGKVDTLLKETYSDPEYWGQQFVDMSHLEGQTVTLALETEAERAGTKAFWSAPTLSGTRSTKKPNVIFYIIDGAGADYMSVYGYNRRTTPNIERLAAEGATFEHAYSNSSFTRPSTASFMISLQHSAFGGGNRNGRNPVPDQVLTMAQHMHRAGYQTAVFTSNGQAGRYSNLERGVDVLRDFRIGNNSVSSVYLHEDFWDWRKAYPAEPYWVHFQTTDVHKIHTPVPPFAGLFISPERRRIADEWLERVRPRGTESTRPIMEALKKLEIDHAAFWTARRDLYDETMAHQDYQIGKLVARLKAAGEWERTLLIIASDHSVGAGSLADFNLLIRDPVPPHVDYGDRAVPMLRPGVSRIPLIVVWPGHISGGQRFSHPVSMIDMLPTILDLTDLPIPEVMQGQSLAPLLLGEAGWEPRPVILDEFWTDRDTGELSGRIEVVDGRWGASLEINPDPEDPPEEQRSVPLLLYDLWKDSECLNSLHEKRPDLVEKYTKLLKARWEAHQALAKHFTRPKDSPLTPEQLETLRSLGYIR